MNNVSQELINEIRNSVDIVDIISSYVGLTPRGKNYFGVCPFHDDNRPSMSVSKDKQIYKCFSCGATGNVFKFLMDYENISFIEAIKKCADLANIKLDVKVTNSNFKNEKNEVLYDIYDNTNKFYQNMIQTSEGKEAKEYLYKRDIDDDLIKEFKIGLSLKDRTLLTQFLTKKNFNKGDLLKSGLIIENNYGISDIYCNRIMFPIEDLYGRVVGFSGRIYNTSDNSKYINTKETDIFKKSEILYNYVRAKDEARNKGYVIIMEGFTAVIRAYQIGIKNVVATMGTALTKENAMTIKKMAKEVYLCFDGDAAGEKATMAAIEEFNKIGVIPKIIRLGDKLDPDDYIRQKGKDSFLSKLDNPISTMDFKLSYLKKNKDISKADELASYVNDVVSELSKIDDDVLKEITLKKLSLESSLDINFLRERIVPSVKEEKKEFEIPKKQFSKLNKYEKAERYLLYYMLFSKETIKIYNNKITFISNPELRILAKEISAYYHKYGDIKLADFLSYIVIYDDLNKTVDNILNLDLPEEVDLNVINDYASAIRENLVNIQIEKLKKKINEETDFKKQAEIAEQICELRKQEI
jgi:DNA primase